jgi:Domain of unknown function (DUF1905)
VAAIGEGAKRFPVVATVNGYTWRTSVTRMSGEFLLGLNRAVREAAGVESGDFVDLRATCGHMTDNRVLSQRGKRSSSITSFASQSAAKIPTSGSTRSP